MQPNSSKPTRNVLDDILKRHRETDVSLYTTPCVANIITTTTTTTTTTSTTSNNNGSNTNEDKKRVKQNGVLRFSDGNKSTPTTTTTARSGNKENANRNYFNMESQALPREDKKNKIEPPPPPPVAAAAAASIKPNEISSRSTETIQFAMPYTPYTVQEEMIQFIKSNLEGITTTTTTNNKTTPTATNAVPVAAAEVPTGCGKTLTLLYTVLQFQHKVNKEIQNDKEAKAYIKARQYNWEPYNHTYLYHQSQNRPSAPASNNDEDSKTLKEYTLPPSFFKQFRVQSNKKLKVELNHDSDECATELRKGFERPRMTVFYLSRTHAQLKQVVGELKKLVSYNVHTSRANSGNTMRVDSMCRVRMNILAGRDRLCIHPLVVRHGQQTAQGQPPPRQQHQGQAAAQAEAAHLLVHENNNLGEVCDKLVSMGKCPCVEGYGDLAAKTLVGPIGTARQHPAPQCTGANNNSSAAAQGKVGSSTTLFDLEDLVLEGVSCQSCPYYAARDLAFFADINFCTYNYLFDPMIRHESKMESILKPDNCILIVDEAHNLPNLCADVVSMEFPVELFLLLEMEVLPLCLCHPLCAAVADVAAAQRRGAESRTYLSYGRDFKLTHFTLVELFLFLYVLLQRVHHFYKEHVPWLVEEELTSHAGNNRNKGMELGQALCTFLVPTLQSIASQCGESAGASSAGSRPTKKQQQQQQQSNPYTWQSMFRQVYSVIMCLGVTFNPFQFSIFALSMLKKLLFILRYVLLRPDAFVCCAKNMNTIAPSSSSSRAPPAAVQQQLQQQERDHDREVRGIRAAMDNIPSYTGAPSDITIPGVATAAAAAARTAAPIVPVSEELEPKRRCYLRCVDPSLAFHHIVQQTYRTILVSGTLSPLDQMERSLGLVSSLSGTNGNGTMWGQRRIDPCWKYFIGRHVVPKAHFRVGALTHMVAAAAKQSNYTTHNSTNSSLVPLRCTYQFLRDDAFKEAVAKTIITICQQSFAAPSPVSSSSASHTRQRSHRGVGVLCFVPNYTLLRDLYHRCQTLLHNHRNSNAVDMTLLQEPHASAELQHTFAHFRQLVLGPTSSTTSSSASCENVVLGHTKKRLVLFFCVYRGKLSEGLDFTDAMARLVLCIGLPLSPLKDYKVVAQKQFYARQEQQQQGQQRKREDGTADGGEVWYVNDAMMAVNQSLGRCLRHAADYGALLLLDERYDNTTHTSNNTNHLAGKLSQWCRNELVSYRTTEDLAAQLRRFFAEMEGGDATNTTAASIIAEEANEDILLSTEGCEATTNSTITSSSPVHLGTVQMPFRKMIPPTPSTSATIASSSREGHGHTTAERPMQLGRLRTVSPPCTPSSSPSLKNKERFKYAALKVLYESVEDTKLCTAEQLKEMMEEMEREYA